MTSMVHSKYLGFALAVLAMAGADVRADDTIRMGVLPLESAKIMFTQFTPLADYLSKELGVKVQIVVGKDYQAAVDALGTNDVQLSYMTPTTYPKCRTQYPGAGVEPVVRFQEQGVGQYTACILVPADKPVKQLAELKGKSFAFGSKDSTGSHLMPRSMLVEAGLNIDKDLKNHGFLGTHTNAATAVVLGEFDAAGVKDSVADELEKQGKVRIIARSKPIPEFPICVNKHVSKEMVAKLSQALLKLSAANPEHKTILTSINKKYTGCETAKDEDYNTIREMIDKLYGPDYYKK